MSLTEILAKRGDEFKKQPLTPRGSYLAVVTGHKFGESSQKKTPYVRFEFRIITPMADVSPEELAQLPEGVAGRTMRDDFYLTEASTVILTDWLKNILSIPGDVPLGQMIPLTTGRQLVIRVGHEISERDKVTPFARVVAYAKAG